MSANNKLFKLQKLLFPTEAICNEEEMYFKGLDFIIVNNKVKFSRGGVLSASTYFNSFSMLKWKRYAGVDNLKLVLDLEGRFQVSVFSMRIRSGKVARTLRSQVQIDASGILDFAIPEAGDEVLYFELVALDDGCVFSGGYYATNLNGRIPNRVKLAIGICTFQREEYIRANLARLIEAIEDNDSLLFGRVKVFVSDNGQTLPVKEIENDNIHIVYNKNLGGAGGFTRCLMEALRVQKTEQFTNFLFLDDDIVLGVSAIERNIAFLALLLPEYAMSVIGGAMFSTDERYLQFESAAKWQRTGFVFNRRDIDLRDDLNILLNEESYDVNYNAWCYCCIPFDVVTATNLPLPVFFHMDDVEYGLRNKLPIITLNGINVWHLYKKALVNAKNDYYDVRNKLIMLSEISPALVGEMAYTYLGSFTKEALKYHYARSLNAFEGIIDFCRGFDWFKHLDTLSKHGKLFNNVKWQPADESIAAQAHASLGVKPGESDRRFRLQAARAQMFGAKKKLNVVYNENQISDATGYRTVAVYVPQENQVIYYKRNLRLSFRCLIAHMRAARAIKKKLPSVVEEFSNRITELQSAKFWQSYLGLPYRLIGDDKKVLFFASDNDSTSGAFRSMVALCSILRNRYNLDVCVLLPKKGDGAVLLKAEGIRYTIINSEDWIVMQSASAKERRKKVHKMRKVNSNALKKIQQFVLEERFDLIHVNTSYSYVGAVVAKKLHVPLVWHIREFLEEDQSREMVNKRRGYALMRKATVVVAISDSIRDKYRPILMNKIVRIYNGIATDLYYNPSKQIFCSDKTVFICVGTIDEYKGQMQAVAALSILRERGYDNFELWLVGNDKTAYADNLRDFVRNHGMDDKVKFLGRRQDVAELYKKSDIACVCSRAEAFGRITVEAMMSGNLVIGADTAGTKEIIADGEDGLLFKSGDANSLYQKIKFALDNKDNARELAAHGRQSAIEKFTADRNAEEVYNLYQDIWTRK